MLLSARRCGEVTHSGTEGRPYSLKAKKKYRLLKMIHSLQKRWVFTWNACENNKLPSSDALQAKLNLIAAEAVFQLERGETTGRKHYQGRFQLLTRKSKRALLKIFSEIFDTSNLTLQVEIVWYSYIYCENF